MTGREKIGLCEDCMNRYGTPAAAVAILGLGVGGKYLLKNGGKFAKNVLKLIKH